MIRLFDYLSPASLQLINSLDTAGIYGTNLLVHYEGTLENTQTYCPFLYYTDRQGTTNSVKPRFFNQVEVPNLWEIRNAGDHADIIDGDHIRGKIHYFPNAFRAVKEVIWLDEKGESTKKDYYSMDGEQYAYGIYQAKKEVFRYYLDQQQQIKIIQDMGAGSFIVKGQPDRFFDNLTQFIQYFIQDLFNKNIITKTNKMLINRLSVPLFVANREQYETILFWQEQIKEEIPGNMIDFLTQKRAVKQIVFQDYDQLTKVKDKYPDSHVKYDYLSPLYRFKREHQNRMKALILTRSDQIHYLDEIAKALPNLEVTVAAPTEMSQKLLDYHERHTNVRLLPQANKQLPKLFEQHDIYLNINAGREVDSVLEKAYLNQMTIISLENTIKNPQYSGIVIEKEDVQKLIEVLKTIQMNQLAATKVWQESMTKKGDLSSKQEYQSVLKKWAD